jgi:hypothetical protein
VRTGGDLVAGSDPGREELESRVKAVSLWRALGLAVDADLEATLAGADAAAVADDIDLPASVALEVDGDPFGAAIAETLRGLGLALDPESSTLVLAGGGETIARTLAEGDRAFVAIGDAAARVLRAAGCAVEATLPQHGRLVDCLPVAGTPSAAMRRFAAMRYATLAVSGEVSAAGRPGLGKAWSPWLGDPAGAPLVLARATPPSVCFLIRPESLLSDPLALDLLRTAIAFASGRGSYSEP